MNAAGTTAAIKKRPAASTVPTVDSPTSAPPTVYVNSGSFRAGWRGARPSERWPAVPLLGSLFVRFKAIDARLRGSLRVAPQLWAARRLNGGGLTCR